MTALRQWRTKAAEERLLVGSEYVDNDFVFATELGKPLNGKSISRGRFGRILEAAELGDWKQDKDGQQGKFRPAFRMYDLRHSCATILLMRGENAKVVSERLGHASVTLTLDVYSHVLPDMQDAAVAKLEAVFGSA